jgi:histidyl-tRNA synthetase
MPKDKEKTNFQLKVPKGTKDWEGRDMVIRDKIFGSIIEVFKRHGAVTIDTFVNSQSSMLLR